MRIQPVLCEKNVILLILGIDKGIPERFSLLAAWESLSHIWGSVVQRKDASQASGTWLGNHGPSEWLGDEQEGRDARYPPDTMTAARVRVSSRERRPGPSASLPDAPLLSDLSRPSTHSQLVVTNDHHPAPPKPRQNLHGSSVDIFSFIRKRPLHYSHLSPLLYTFFFFSFFPPRILYSRHKKSQCRKIQTGIFNQNKII